MNLSHVPEGAILKRTALPAALLVVLSTVLSLPFVLPLPGGAFVWPDAPLPAAAAAGSP